MKNFLKEHYDHYYIQSADGQTVETTRAECFVPGDEPTADNPFKQRWYYDIEAGYIIRLPRNAEGERLFLSNEALTKSEERYRVDKYACVRKSRGKNGCTEDCEYCTRRVARTVDLDKPTASDADDEENPGIIIGDPDIFAEHEDVEERNAEYARLHEVIKMLPEKRQKVCYLYFFDGCTAEEIGEMLGVSKQAVLQQIATIKNSIKKLF